jgi:anti-anti-sigma factor
MHRTGTKFELREINPTCLLLTCAGGLSWEDRDVLANEVEHYLQPRPALTGVVLDLAAVQFVNSAGLGALFQLIRRVRERHGRLVFANVPPTLLRMFAAVGIDRMAGIGTDVKAALALLAESTALETARSPACSAADAAAPSS